jgi:hypothetical protein
MTPEEAIKSMQNLKLVLCITDSERSSVNTAIDALEKQIPKKSTEYVDYEFSVVWTCPTCWRVHITEWKTKYCSDCGQAIDWGD